MIGNRLVWKCSECNTVMQDVVGGVILYKVNGENYFIKMSCDKCGKVHYVKEDSSKVIMEDNAFVEENGVCFF